MIRCARFLGEGWVAIETVPLPAVPAGHVVVRVLRCALCGSDLRLWRGGAAHVPGHEIVGVVDAPGRPLDGRRALVYIPIYCGTCAYCRAGDPQLCERLTELVGWQRPGGYADAVVVPERNLIPLPDDVPTDLAPLLLDTIGTVAHAIRLARRAVQAGPAAVLGAGPLGLGCVIALPHLGFEEVHCSEPSARRAALAQELGARALAVGSVDRRFPLVVEASGNLGARNQGLAATAPGGVLVLLGENSAPWTIEPSPALRRKDFFVLRSFYFPLREMDDNLALLRRAQAKYSRLVDGRAPLDGLGPLFERFAAGDLTKPQMTCE